MVTFPEIEEGQGPILMLNLLKFRDKELYFKEYVPAFNKVVKQLGVEGTKLSLASDVLGNIIAEEGEVWDAILLVEYPSAEAFKTIALSSEYHEIAEPIRLAALADLKLFMTRKFDL